MGTNAPTMLLMRGFSGLYREYSQIAYLTSATNATVEHPVCVPLMAQILKR